MENPRAVVVHFAPAYTPNQDSQHCPGRFYQLWQHLCDRFDAVRRERADLLKLGAHVESGSSGRLYPFDCTLQGQTKNAKGTLCLKAFLIASVHVVSTLVGTLDVTVLVHRWYNLWYISARYHHLPLNRSQMLCYG